MKVVTATQETLEVDDTATPVATTPSQPSIDDNKPGEITDPATSPKESTEDTSTAPQKAAKRQQTSTSIPPTSSRPTEAVCHSHSGFTIQTSTLCLGEQGEGTVTAPKRPRGLSTSPPTSPRALDTMSIDFHLPQHHPPSSNTPLHPVHIACQSRASSPSPRTPSRTSRASSPTVDALGLRIKRLNIRGRADDDDMDYYIDSAPRSPVITPSTRQRRCAFIHRNCPWSAPSTYKYRSPLRSDRKITTSRPVTPSRTQSALRERRVLRSVPHMHIYSPPRRIFRIAKWIGRHPVRVPTGQSTARQTDVNASAAAGVGTHDDDDVFASKST
ncbi:hypothetical protein GL218_02838 [Daldinia childiae]|uniref:uncharacterized protein n=1 Tax=Daldinia childiae TaxID=326645 RepID=UPI00144738D9|nr:uncharacterized protein GL218_02838 [Daldinia childiae]KAF3061206.1 hypothetical protein GL218_02838 [Daldinia childiae]